MSVFAALGRSVGESIIAEMRADGSLDWAIRSGMLDGIEAAVGDIADPCQRRDAIDRIAEARRRLGPNPRQKGEMASKDIMISLVIAVALMMVAATVAPIR